MPSALEFRGLPVEREEPSPIWPGLSATFQLAAQHTPDPDRVERYLTRFAQLHPSFSKQLEQEPERLRWLTLVFLLSQFLSNEVLQSPELIFEVSEINVLLSTDRYRQRLASLLRIANRSADAALHFARFRRKELLRILIRDGLGLASLSDLTEEISNLADAILESALGEILPALEARYGAPRVPTGNTNERAAFSIIALGKLGGRELNYSSDIDLVFLYSANGETSGPDVITNKEFFKRVSNQLTTLLSSYTAAGVCYRVDLRLRPEGRHGEVCTSLSGTQEYYATRARDWELQMLIKARRAAGDCALGEALLNFVEPLIYSTTLDFSTIEAVSATRERLGEKLARRRMKADELDIKLTRGGIRDIEFLAQCLQRLHGAHDVSVRHTGTLYALSSLFDSDLLSRTEHAQLAEAYTVLRHLEHRLQFEEDRQIHTLPTDLLRLEQIARRMPASLTAGMSPLNTASRLLEKLNQHLENVQVIYERIVHAQRPLSYRTQAKEDPERRSQRGLTGEVIAFETEDAFPAVGETESWFANLQGKRIPRHSDKLAGFLTVASHRGYRETLNNNALLRSHLAKLFELSPFLSEQLIQTPELIEEVERVAASPGERPAFERLAAPLSDVEGLRRFYTRELFRILVSSVCVPEPVFHTLDRTSGLAEFLIARAYRIALEQALAHAGKRASTAKPLPVLQSQMMVVAVGRLGMREFDLGSDADLLFILPDVEVERQPFWTRVAERIIQILTSYQDGGPMISIDTRLRPNGREGPLVQTESAYVDYFSNKAEAWEGLAYMKARAVAGDLERAITFLIHLQQLDWRRYGQSGRSREMLRQMRLKLEKEQGSAVPLKAAKGGYYDADFVLMYLRLKGAGLFFRSLNTPERIEVVEKMGHLERVDAEFLLRATAFFRALDHATRLVSGSSDGKLPQDAANAAIVADLMRLWTYDHLTTAESLQLEIESLQEHMRHLFDAVFKSAA